MVPVLEHKLKEGWRELGACSKDSDHNSDRRTTGKGHGDEENILMETRRIYSRGYNWYLKYLEPCQVQEKTVLFSLHDYRRVGTRGKWFQFTFRKNFLRRRTLQRWGGPEGTYNPQLDMNELRLVWGYRGQRFYNGKSGIGREIRLDSFSGLVQLCDSWGSMLVTD